MRGLKRSLQSQNRGATNESGNTCTTERGAAVNMAAERAVFEKTFKSSNLYRSLETNNYVSPATEALWAGWSTRAALASIQRSIPRGRGEGAENVSQRRIVCAALRAPDGELLLGIRHYSADMRRQIYFRHDGAKFKHLHDENQGFVDQHGVYVGREEAYRVAQEAGQITRPQACGNGLDGPKLYSEGLY